MGGVRPSEDIVRFGPFELNSRTGELRKQGAKIKLQEQPFQILLILLQRRGEPVTRDELQQKIWPSDTFVDFDHGLYNAIRRLREALEDSAEAPRYVETLARKGYRFIAEVECEAPRARSLAVLPLENLSHDPEQEYFAEGLTEALITTLAKIGELRVVSRTSVMQYKGVHKPVREIARELEVETIVEGTVQRADNRVRITAQLIDAAREAHLWAEGYERDMRDILALQLEVAQAIAREVRVRLTPLDEARFANVHPVEPEAYDAYLKGRYHWNRRSKEGLGRATQCFQRAIEKDPSYGAAYAGLADCLSTLSVWSFVSPAEGCGKAKALAEKSLALDHGSAEAHTSLAMAVMWYDYDFSTAERAFERSIELDPRYVTAHEYFGVYLGLVMGRFDEAYTEFKRALRLDPVSSIINTMLGYVYYSAHRYDDAIEQYEKTLELDSAYAVTYWGLALAYGFRLQHEAAIASMKTGMQLSAGAPTFIAALGDVYAAAGCRTDVQQVLQSLQEISQQRYVSPYLVARIYAALGEKDEALRWLETAYRERAVWMVLLKTDPRFDNLRSDPHFQDLMRRMNFPQLAHR